MRKTLSFFSKKISFTLVIALLISMFILCFNVPSVNATYGTEISTLTFKGWDTEQGNSISDGTYNVFAVDDRVLIYDNLGNLSVNFTPIPYLSGTVATVITKIIEFNSTHIIVVSIIYYAYSGYYGFNLRAFYLELSTGNNTPLSASIASGSVLNSQTGTTTKFKLTLVETISNNIYAIVGYSDSTGSGGCSGTSVFRIYPTQSLINNYNNVSGSPDSNFVLAYGAISVVDKLSSDAVYVISRRNSTSYWLWHVDLSAFTLTNLGSFNDYNGAISSLTNFYTFKINEAYGIFNAGNYSLAFASSFTNASLNAINIYTVFFDGSSFLGVAQTLVDFTGSRTPIRIISKINQIESWVGSYSLIAIDSDRNYRNLGIYLGTNGIGLLPCRDNYGILAIYGTLYTSGWGNFLGLFSWGTHGVEGWTYINYPKFYFETSNSIGGYQDVINSNIMFMIDYQNGKVNVQTTKISVEGLATKLYIDNFDNSFTVYNGSYANSFVASLLFSKNWLGQSPAYRFKNSVFIGTVRLTSTVGYWSLYLSTPSQTPYTHEDIEDLLLQVPTQTGSLNGASDGYFLFDIPTGQPAQNYYYQLMVVTASYQTEVNGTDVYLSATSYVLIVGYKNGVTPLPTGLPDDYDINNEDNTGYTPPPTSTPTSTPILGLLGIPDSYIAVGIYAICLIGFIYAFYALHIGSGAISLIVGLAVATIICNILNLLGIWTLPIDALIVVVVAIIIYAGRT